MVVQEGGDWIVMVCLDLFTEKNNVFDRLFTELHRQTDEPIDVLMAIRVK